jgi:hypothetical protein
LLRKLRNFIATRIISATLTVKRGLGLFVAKVSQYLEADKVKFHAFSFYKPLHLGLVQNKNKQKMKNKLLISVLLALIGLSVFAQPKYDTLTNK